MIRPHEIETDHDFVAIKPDAAAKTGKLLRNHRDCCAFNLIVQPLKDGRHKDKLIA